MSCGANDVAQWYCVELYRALAEVPGIHAVVVPRVGRLPLDLPAGTGDTRYERNRIYRYDDDRSVERAKAALRGVTFAPETCTDSEAAKSPRQSSADVDTPSSRADEPRVVLRSARDETQ